MRSIKILSNRELQGMREVGRLAGETLAHAGEHLRVGMTTAEINEIVHEFTLKAGARPATLGYKGYPASVCTSLNHVVCHGIPDKTRLADGDIINIDVTSVLPAVDGFFGDTSATFYVGEAGPFAKHVVEVARRSLEVGISVVRPGARVGDIGFAIQSFAEAKGCSVVRDYTGHGIHRVFHDEPNIPHYGRPGLGPLLKKGMVFTIEPMINLGAFPVELLDDRWTVVTADGSLSAQFEHTIAVTDSGCEVLTARSRTLVNSEDKAWADLGPRSCFIPGSASAR